MFDINFYVKPIKSMVTCSRSYSINYYWCILKAYLFSILQFSSYDVYQCFSAASERTVNTYISSVLWVHVPIWHYTSNRTRRTCCFGGQRAHAARCYKRSKMQISSDISALSIDALLYLGKYGYTLLGCATIASCKQCCAAQCSFRLAPLMLCTALLLVSEN